MITLIKMKLKEWKIKLALYTVIEKLITEQKDITALISDLYAALKDVPFNELKDEFIMKLADIIHDQAEAERNAETSNKED